MLPVAIELDKRISWLINLRWLAIAGVICVIEIGRHVFSLHLAIRPLYAVLSCLTLYNIVLALISKHLPGQKKPLDSYKKHILARLIVPRTFWGLGLEGKFFHAAVFACIQITIDLVFLALLIHFSGGIENPFRYFFIFHVIIASILFSRRATYIQTTLGLLFISAVAFGESLGIIEHYSLKEMWLVVAYQDQYFISTRLFVLGVTLYLSAYMSSNIAVYLRQRLRDIVLLSRELDIKASELEKTYNQVKQSEYAKSQYMKKVAHELQGPLGTIQTALKVVLQGLTGSLSEKSKDQIERAERRAYELSIVTKDLLALSRAKTAREIMEISTVHPKELVAEIIEEQKESAKKVGVSLLFEAASDLVPLQADAVGLRQVVSNLVSNAIRYTPRDGSVIVRIYKSKNILCFEVEDTGIGIPKEDLEKIFDEFFRAPNARKHTADGTGLGLSIVKSVAQQHNGTVKIDSTLGKGTKVTVDIPIVGLIS